MNKYHKRVKYSHLNVLTEKKGGGEKSQKKGERIDR